jgi:hypothetical protein
VPLPPSSHESPGIGEREPAVRIGEHDDVGTDGVAHREDSLGVDDRIVAHLHLQPAVSLTESLDRLRPAPWNPCTIKHERFQSLVRSIQADPGLSLAPAHPGDGRRGIYAGNMRYPATQHRGMPTVPAISEDMPRGG